MATKEMATREQGKKGIKEFKKHKGKERGNQKEMSTRERNNQRD